EVGGRRRVSCGSAVVLRVAALRAAAARLPDRGIAAAARGGGGDQPPAAAGNRNAAVTQADRNARDRAAASGRTGPGRGDRDRTRRPGGSPCEIHRRATMT